MTEIINTLVKQVTTNLNELYRDGFSLGNSSEISFQYEVAERVFHRRDEERENWTQICTN